MDTSPTNYKLSFEPDLKKFTFDGLESISINCKKSVNVITMNYPIKVYYRLFNRIQQRKTITQQTHKQNTNSIQQTSSPTLNTLKVT